MAGCRETSETANEVLLLVLQYTMLKKQLKYLAIVKIAAQNHKTKSAEPTFLIDRIKMKYSGRPGICEKIITNRCFSI